MMILVDPNSGIPVYRQLMDQIKFFVSSGVLVSGDSLPSTRTLSSQLGINPMTISKAYSFLEKENVLERRPGLPLVVKEISLKEEEGRRLKQLQDSLKHPAQVARQLGITPSRALAAFKTILETQEGEDNESTGV